MEGCDEMLNDAAEIINEAVNSIDDENPLSQENYNQLVSYNIDLSTNHCPDAVKKMYCNLLYQARIRAVENSVLHLLLFKLELDFRKACKPLLNNISDFEDADTVFHQACSMGFPAHG